MDFNKPNEEQFINDYYDLHDYDEDTAEEDDYSEEDYDSMRDNTKERSRWSRIAKPKKIYEKLTEENYSCII